MKSLMPGTYKSNMKLSIVPTNKIDTVNSTRLYNNLTETDIHSESYTEAKVFGAFTTLPLSSDVIQSHQVSGSRYMTNISQAGAQGEKQFAKGRIDYILGSGETIIKVDTPISGMPEVKISLSGSSVYADHKKLKGTGGADVPEAEIFVCYPSMDEFKDASWNFAEWVEAVKTNTNDNSLIWNYEDGRISLNPWVGKLNSASIVKDAVIPTEVDGHMQELLQDVLYPSQVHTAWAPVHEGTFARTGARYYGWSDNGTGPIKDVTRDNNTEHAYSSRMPVKDTEYVFEARLTKLSDYSFKVNWTVPVMVMYAAVAQDRNFFDVDEKLLDSYAFVDYIKSVTVTLHGTPFNTDTFVDGYSYDDEGLMTTELKNTHTHSVSDSSVITTDSLFTGDRFRNLFDSENAVEGIINYQNGELDSNTAGQGVFKASGYIRILANAYFYYLLGKRVYEGAEKVAYTYALYDEQGNYLSGGYTGSNSYSSSSSASGVAITVTDMRAKLLRVSFDSEVLTEAHVARGTSENLYDKSTEVVGMLDASTGLVDSSYPTARTSVMIPVDYETEQGYILVAHRTATYAAVTQFVYCWYNSEGTFLSGGSFTEDSNFSARRIYPPYPLQELGRGSYLRVSYYASRAEDMRVMELFTPQVYQRYHNPDWAYVVSDEILERYIDGRYMVECDVPARWCMDKQLRINDDVVVLNQKSNLILRDKFACIFRVKNITKKFVDDAYVYSLKLLEEKSAYEFDFSSDKVSLNTNITLTDLFGSTGDLYKIASVTGSATKVNNKTFRTSSLNYSLHLVRDL